MRIACIAAGPRGDVEPFRLIAAELVQRGHSVTLALDAGLHEGEPTHPELHRRNLSGRSRSDLAAIVADAYRQSDPGTRTEHAFTHLVGDRERELSAELVALDAANHDVLVIPPYLTFPLVFRRSGWGPLEYAARWATPTAVVLPVLATERDYRELTAVSALQLAMISPWLIREHERHEGWQFVGFAIDRKPRELAPEIESFLGAGPPPIVLTTGSGAGLPRSLATWVIDAARSLGARTIVRRGWADLDAGTGGDVLTIDDTNFASLFPRCAVVVALGGMGTVGQALHAGRPTIVLAAVNDQIELAHRLIARRACVAAIDPYTTTPVAIGALLERALRDPRYAAAARATAEAIADEDGIAAACDAVETLARR